MKKIFISTTSFADDDPTILNALAKAGMSVTMNPHKRKLNEAEILNILDQGLYEGLLAGLDAISSGHSR